MKIQAIETKYKGYRFRSRLEARWAVAFDTLGVEWRYEPEGFQLPSGKWYLPDFRVTTKSGNKAWVEIKGNARFSSHYRYIDSFEGDEKTKEFARYVTRKGGLFLLLCDIPEPQTEEITPWGKDMFSYDPVHDSWSNICFCIAEFAYGLYDIHVIDSLDFDSRSEELYIMNGQKEECPNGLKYRLYWPTEAYEKARSARFEHGETPR